MSPNVRMSREGQEADVHAGPSVEIMKGLGWREIDAKKPSDGLNVEELRAALTAKGIAIPDGAKKPDLQALLDLND